MDSSYFYLIKFFKLSNNLKQFDNIYYSDLDFVLIVKKLIQFRNNFYK